MAMRARRSGGDAVGRWVYGVIVTLCAVLAVLVHHEVSAIGISPMSGISGVFDAAGDHAAMSTAAHAAHVMPDAAEPPSVSGSAAHNLDDGACAGVGMQHCGAASVVSTQLAVPDHSGVLLPVDFSQTLSGHAPAAVVSRAPPELSVLSQLRI